MKNKDFIVMAGPPVLESVDEAVGIAKYIKRICDGLGFRYIFKGNFEKPYNRSGRNGPGCRTGLLMLELIKLEARVEVATEVYESWQVAPVAAVADVLQISVFMRDAVSFAAAASSAGKPVNMRKGACLSGRDMTALAGEIKKAGSCDIWLCECGSAMGVGKLAVDMRNFEILGRSGCPVIFDATCYNQMVENGAYRYESFAGSLAQAAMKAGINGLYMDTHPDPANAIYAGGDTVPLEEMGELLVSLKESQGARAIDDMDMAM